MKLNRDEFEKLAVLSALEFSEDETIECIDELNEIIGLADSVGSWMHGSADSIKNVTDTEISSESLREDEIIPSFEAGEVLANGINDGDYFVVNRIK